MLNITAPSLGYAERIANWPQISRDPPRIELRRAQAKHMSLILHDYCKNYDIRAKKKDPERFKMLLNVLWRDLMADYQYVLDPMQMQRKACAVDCFRHKTMMCISHEARLYGCWLHGYVHECAGDNQSCRDVHTNNELQEICIYSGAPLGIAFIHNGDSTYKKVSSNTNGSDGMQRRKYALSREEIASKRNAFEIRPELPVVAKVESEAEEASRRRASILAEMQHELDKKRKFEASLREPTAAKRSASAAVVSATAAAAADGKNEAPAPKIPKAAVDEQKADKLRRIALARVEQVIEGVFHDLLESENRRVFNQYCEGEHEWRMKKKMDDYLKSVPRNQTLPNFSTMMTIIANVNNSLDQLVVDVDRPQQLIGRYKQIIKQLWNVCFASPYAKQQMELARDSPAQDRRRSRSSSPAAYRFTPTPSNTGLCTLRQFTLAILYSLNEGFSLQINSEFAIGSRGNQITVFAANEKLAALLPPRAKVHYFGIVARRALSSRIARSYYGPARFNPLENLTLNEEAVEAREASSELSQFLSRGSRVDEDRTQLAMFSEGGAALREDHSASSLKSRGIASTLINSQRSIIRRKSRKRKMADTDSALVVAERETRNYTLGSAAAGASFTTLTTCVKPHLREPFLTAKAKIYTDQCIEEGLRMLSMSLQSYGTSLEHTLQSQK